MNNDKAYIFGMVVGGGIWKHPEDCFQIHLPYDIWGDAQANPARAAQISSDIMRYVNPLFHNVYGINVSYEGGRKYWTIFCESSAELVDDLRHYGIEPLGELRDSVQLDGLLPALSDNNLKKRFIAGLADTIGSTSLSHRRFNNEYPTISFEFKGFNYRLVCSVCKLLRNLGCKIDQVLWNHPNLHSGKNPYYKQWKKGTKLRVMLHEFETYGAFAFTSRATSARENLDQRSNHHPTITDAIERLNISYSCKHLDENYVKLPLEIKGGHFLHWKHICACLGCENTPTAIIEDICNNAEFYCSPFPIVSKFDSLDELDTFIEENELFANRNYTPNRYSIRSLIDLHERDSDALFLSHEGGGYSINNILEGIAFIIANDNELKGQRPIGGTLKILNDHLCVDPNLQISFLIPDKFTPLQIRGENRGVLIGPKNPLVYSSLIERDSTNKYKFKIRDINEEDL